MLGTLSEPAVMVLAGLLAVALPAVTIFTFIRNRGREDSETKLAAQAAEATATQAAQGVEKLSDKVSALQVEIVRDYVRHVDNCEMENRITGRLETLETRIIAALASRGGT